ncbi:unnamed protein product [Protopolystoma xenopodis]|uniref:Uncharacterized protein n=1 Tax=Protopolystoma xenopodis TaxID=117903 RepID=A0A448X4J1_9PLAT|nr:unnamed protein product [Protopolystoma xenopodis]
MRQAKHRVATTSCNSRRQILHLAGKLSRSAPYKRRVETLSRTGVAHSKVSYMKNTTQGFFQLVQALTGNWYGPVLPRFSFYRAGCGLGLEARMLVRSLRLDNSGAAITKRRLPTERQDPAKKLKLERSY